MRRFLLFILFFTTLCNLNAQTFRLPASLNSGSELVELAFSDVFVIVRQNYALEDADGQKFGRGGASYFNAVDYMAIKTTSGLLLFDDIMTPWQNDKEFIPFKESYKPYIVSTSLLDASGIKVQKDSMLISENNYCCHDKAYYTICDSLCVDGLYICQSDTISNSGWMVWLSQKSEKVEKPAMHISKLSVSRKKDNTFEDLVSPDLSGKIIGGLYITPAVFAAGTLSFMIQAVAMPEDGTRWRLVPTCNNDNTMDSKELTPLSNNEEKISI